MQKLLFVSFAYNSMLQILLRNVSEVFVSIFLCKRNLNNPLCLEYWVKISADDILI